MTTDQSVKATQRITNVEHIERAIDVNSPRIPLDRNTLPKIGSVALCTLGEHYSGGAWFYTLEPLYEALGLDIDLDTEYLKEVKGARPAVPMLLTDDVIFRGKDGHNHAIVMSRDHQDAARFENWLYCLEFVINNKTYTVRNASFMYGCKGLNYFKLWDESGATTYMLNEAREQFLYERR